MKFHWGHGIAAFYSLFVVVMLGAVMLSTKKNPGLVAKDYYQLDLNYQAHLEKKQHATALPLKPTVRYDASQSVVEIQFPQGAATTGKVKFLRPSTPGTDDFVVNIETDTAAKMTVPFAEMPKSRWRVELDWVAEGVPYFWETAVFIQ